MKAMVILVHGFNVWDGGRQSVGKLRSFFATAGVTYTLLNYGHFGLWDTRTKNDKVALRLSEAVNGARSLGYKVIVVGHSNGCAIIHRASELYGVKINKAVYINPALRKGLAPYPSIESIDVWHSPSDRPVKWARYLPASDARPWGAMGATGYSGRDERITNFNKEEDFDFVSNEHSDVFRAEKITYFGPLIVGKALENIV